MNQNQKVIYSEINEILSYMDESYIKKLPKKLIEFFGDNSLQNYEKHINPNISLKSQNINKKTRALLAYLNLKYFIEDKKEKNFIKELYIKNEELYQKKKIGYNV